MAQNESLTQRNRRQSSTRKHFRRAIESTMHQPIQPTSIILTSVVLATATVLASVYSSTPACARALPALHNASASPGPKGDATDIATARDLVRSGRLAEATILLEVALVRRPNDRELIIALSQTYTAAGQRGKAIALLLRFIAAQPDDSEARAILAGNYMANHDFPAAEEQYLDILRAHSEDNNARAGLAE